MLPSTCALYISLLYQCVSCINMWDNILQANMHITEYLQSTGFYNIQKYHEWFKTVIDTIIHLYYSLVSSCIKFSLH